MALQVGTLTATLKLDKNKFQSDMMLAQKQMRRLAKDIQGVADKLNDMGNKLTMGVTVPVIAMGAYAVKAAVDSETAISNLGLAMGRTGDNTKATMKSMQDFATATMKQTTYDDEAIMSAMALGKNRGIETSKLQESTKAAIGLAARYKVDLPTAMGLIAKASKGIFTPLKRMGIVLDETGSAQDKFNQLLTIGSGSFSTAQKQAQTAEGRMLQLKNSIGEVAEAFGKDLMPMVRDVMGTVAGLAKSFENLPKGTRKTIITIMAMAALAGPLLKLAAPVVSLVGWFTKMGGLKAGIGAIGSKLAAVGPALVGFFASPPGLIIAAVVAVIAGLVILYRNVKQFRTAVNAFWKSISGSFMMVWNSVKKLAVALWPIIKLIAKVVFGPIVLVVVTALIVALKVVAVVFRVIAKIITGIGDGITKMINKLKSALAGPVGKIKDAFNFGKDWNPLDVIVAVMKVIGFIIIDISLGIIRLTGLLQQMVAKFTKMPSIMNAINDIPYTPLKSQVMDTWRTAILIAGVVARAKKKHAKEVTQAEIDGVMAVIEKQRQAAEERRQQLREQVGFGSLTGIWENAMLAGAKTAVGAKNQSVTLTAQNAPTPKEIKDIAANTKRQADQQKQLNDYIQRSLTYA